MDARLVLIRERRSAFPGLRLELDADAVTYLGTPEYVRLRRSGTGLHVEACGFVAGDGEPVRALTVNHRRGRVAIGRLAQQLGLRHRVEQFVAISVGPRALALEQRPAPAAEDRIASMPEAMADYCGLSREES